MNTNCTREIEDDHNHPSYCYTCTRLYDRIYSRHKGDKERQQHELRAAGFLARHNRRVHERIYIDSLGRQRFKYSKEEYEGWLLDQDGMCAICQRDDEVLVVDHDHTTYQFRGLLCYNCNSGLGLLGDSPERLMRAASYLVDRRRVRPQEF